LVSSGRGRFESRPVLELIDLDPRGDDVVSVTYQRVTALLGFDHESGKIAWLRCGSEA
jgi:hypothetical protein